MNHKQHKWEQVDGGGSLGGGVVHLPTWRMRVPGGWVYRYGNELSTFVPMPQNVGRPRMSGKGEEK